MNTLPISSAPTKEHQSRKSLRRRLYVLVGVFLLGALVVCAVLYSALPRPIKYEKEAERSKIIDITEHQVRKTIGLVFLLQQVFFFAWVSLLYISFLLYLSMLLVISINSALGALACSRAGRPREMQIH